MSKKRKGMLVAITAFASSPQGRRMIQQAREYAARPETKQKAQQLLTEAKNRRKGGSTGTGASSTATPTTTPSTTAGTTTGTPRG